MTYLKAEFSVKVKEKRGNFHVEATLFHKLWHIIRLFRQFSKPKTKEHKREELNARVNLEVATARLHDDIYNVELQREVYQYKRTIEEIERRKARGASIRSRVKWQRVGDKCSAKFF